jgi:hypothetical protein
MSTEHPPQTFMAGDDWQIEASLRDRDGIPINLINADLDWFLLDQANDRVIDGSGVGIEMKDRTAGTCAITVAAATTAKLSPGIYSDMLRLTLHSGPGTPVLLRATVWEGTIKVDSNARADLPAARGADG